MKKHCVAKVLLAIWETFLHEKNRSYNFSRLSDKFLFVLFFSFLTNQNQTSGFQQFGGLVMRNISVFCTWRVALYFKAMLNSIEFYKGIFLRVIPVRIIIPWEKLVDYDQYIFVLNKKFTSYCSTVISLRILVEKSFRLLSIEQKLFNNDKSQMTKNT